MIAPLRSREPDDSTTVEPRLRRARRAVVEMFLNQPAAVESSPRDVPRPVPGWQAWLATGWLVLVASVYVWCMFQGR